MWKKWIEFRHTQEHDYKLDYLTISKWISVEHISNLLCQNQQNNFINHQTDICISSKTKYALSNKTQ